MKKTVEVEISDDKKYCDSKDVGCRYLDLLFNGSRAYTAYTAFCNLFYNKDNVSIELVSSDTTNQWKKCDACQK